MKRSLLALTLLAALPFAASAQDAKSNLSYNYVQGGYTHVNSDTNANGWAVDGSAAIAPNFHVFGGYSAVKADSVLVSPGVTSKPKLDQWKVGVGYNHSIAANTDFVGTLAYQKAEAKLAKKAAKEVRKAEKAAEKAAKPVKKDRKVKKAKSTVETVVE